MSLVVRLDRAEYGAGPGTVVAVGVTLGEYLGMVDRDGARDPRLRLWGGEAQVGERVALDWGGAEDKS